MESQDIELQKLKAELQKSTEGLQLAVLAATGVAGMAVGVLITLIVLDPGNGKRDRKKK